MADVVSIENFNPNVEDFDTYVSRVELFFDTNDFAENKRVPALLALGGASIYSLARDLLSPNNPKDVEYKQLVTALKEHYEPKIILIYERYKFYSRSMKSVNQ